MSYARGAVFLFAAFLQVKGQSPAHPEVLVVYNANTPDSLTVANHYMSVRNIPAANLCAIAPPSTDGLNLSDYTTYLKTPIQNCLNAVPGGSKSILYIVMSYLTPYDVGAGPFATSAVDSYLADIWDKYSSQPFIYTPSITQPYYADSQSQGNFYSPFQSLAAYRANTRNPLIYSVWRLDAPTAALASALVDQAMAVEASGKPPMGLACIDQYLGDPTTGPAPDFAYWSGDWDLYQAASFLRQAGTIVDQDFNGTEFGTPPSPLTCAPTAFYTGWYSYDNYNDAFAWQTGSIGWHLDSASALTPRGGPSWSPNALLRGIAVTTGAVTEPLLEGMVRPGGAYRNLLEGASVGDAFLRNTRWLKWNVMYMGDPLYKPFGAGLPPFHPLQPVNSFQLSPQEIVGDTSSTGTITLSAAAPSGGTVFSLSAPAGVSVPAQVTVAGGTTKASFPIMTAAVAGSQTNIITATGGAITLTNTLITDPLLGSLVPSFTTTMAGLPISVTALLNGRAPTGGAVISLSSDNPAITVPATITVPAGATVANFMIGSTPVPSTVTANITGTSAGAGAAFQITVVPAIAGMGPSPSTISPGGYTVIAVVLGANVPPGNTATVQFTSSDPVALPVPASITIPAGSNYGNFLALANPGASAETVTITATYGGATVTAGGSTATAPLIIN